ncbi:MAG: nucleotidyltransferase domain-containing protein [Tunicatimonas sp.]|uniref:nucleotidyltransferase domain-containing protein n=1 Tax=Tunicatimonas sp. TaxID=1940096 RepID=UPI003C78EE46
MKPHKQSISQLIRDAVRAVDTGADVILYGSRARGDERIDSDWDILVLTDYPVDLAIERKFRNKIYDVELDTGEAISLFVYSKKQWRTQQSITPFYENVTQEGIVL